MDARTLPTLQQLNPLNAPSPRRVKYMNSLDQIPNLSPEDREIMKKVSERYVFRANDYYLRLIDWADPKDPIKQLIIPRQEELNDWGKLDASNEAANVAILRDQMAELEHDLWCDERISLGWRYGAKRDNARRIQPLLVPYEKLPEEQKSKDRRQVLGYVEHARKAGYRIVWM